MPSNTNKKFQKAFEGFEDYYVIIGGTAASIILEDNSLESRTTKDYDIVILDDKKNKAFYQAIIGFLNEGDYSPSIMDRDGKLYRFVTKKADYPKMIELFCVIPNWFKAQSRTAPVHFDEDMSLSALLLDKDYYSLLEQGKTLINGYSILDNEHLIVFKAKAWLDLTQKKEAEQNIDSKNIKKHLNDITRLTASLRDNNHLVLPPSIKEDMKLFINKLGKNISSIPQNNQIFLDRDTIFQALKELLV